MSNVPACVFKSGPQQQILIVLITRIRIRINFINTRNNSNPLRVRSKTPALAPRVLHFKGARLRDSCSKGILVLPQPVKFGPYDSHNMTLIEALFEGFGGVGLPKSA